MSMNIGTTGLEMKLECEGMTRNGTLCCCMLLPHDCLQGSNLPSARKSSVVFFFVTRVKALTTIATAQWNGRMKWHE